MSTIGALTPEQEADLLAEIRDGISIQHGDKLSLWPVKFIEKYHITQDLSEKELKVLEVDLSEALQKIYTFSPTLVYHGTVDDARYDFPPGDSQEIIETMRIRKKNEDYYLTIKKKNTSKTIKDRQEFEVLLSNPQSFAEMFEALGLVAFHKKRKIRYSYTLEGVDNVMIDIDMYYGIPALLEIEAPDEETIRYWIKKLGYTKDNKIKNWSARQTLKYYDQW